MSEPRFINSKELEEIKESVSTIESAHDRNIVEDLVHTLDKLFLAVETASEILTHMAELNRDEKEIEREDWKTKGEDLTYLRNQHDMSHADMARVLNCKAATLIDAERGVINPTDLQRLAVEKLMRL